MISDPKSDVTNQACKSQEFRRNRKGRNLLLVGAIFAFCALFYLITVVRML